MTDRESLPSKVQVLRVEDIDDELLDEIKNAKWGEMSDDGPAQAAVKDERDEHIERLEELLYDIALMADGHKVSRLYLEGENVALVTIRNMAAGAIGMGGLLREKGTLLAAGTAVADRD